MPFLDWVNKNQAKETVRSVPYHLLKQESVHGDVNGLSAENLLIQGDNLLALKALIPFYAGQVKCIFIDPPYNTQSAFEHYDDRLEHSQWLSMMYPRLVLLRDLLADDGSIWVTLDDNEAHYFKVLMDEVFGRQNFICNVVWQKRYSRENRVALGSSHDHLLVFGKKISDSKFKFNKLPLEDKQLKVYKNPNNDPKGAWRGVSLTAQGFRPNQMYTITAPSGKTHIPPAGSCWKVIESKYEELLKNGLIYFGKDGNAAPSRKQYLEDIEGIVPWSWWPHEEAGHTDEAKRESQIIFGEDDPFGTPKPERLINRVIQIASNEGDIVLDSFLGSGTTAAVAHKMGRRYIGIEMGEHAQTHCLTRLKQVINGEQGGVSETVKWTGGGGFRFCTLGDTAFDEDGRINKSVTFATLAAFIWHFETGVPGPQKFDSPLLGVHNGTAYYLLFNGILGDRKPAGGNVLTRDVLDAIYKTFPHDGPKVVFGEISRLGPARLAAEKITFKQIPYDVSVR